MSLLRGFKFSAVLGGLAISALAGAAMPADAPMTRPADNGFDARDASSAKSVDHAVQSLLEAVGGADPAERDAAANRLREMGAVAVPSLGQAARSESPELRVRAKALLRDIHWDMPDDADAVGALLHTYGKLDPGDRRSVVRRLAAMTGDVRQSAWRALGRLMVGDPDEEVGWEIVAEMRTRGIDQLPNLEITRDISTMSAPMNALAGRALLTRDPQAAASYFLRALELDEINPAEDRAEAERVADELTKLAGRRDTPVERIAAIRGQLLRFRSQATAAKTRPTEGRAAP